MDKLREKWLSLNPRERLYVSVAGIVVLVAVVYFWLINPLNNAVATTQSQLAYQQDLLTWMQPRVQSLRGQQKSGQQAVPISTTELLPTIDQRLKNAAFASNIDSVTQNNANDVRITLKDVPFDELLNWLATQWQTSHINVTALDVQRGSKLGLVDANVVLTA
jgi:general secretion pathway protein M